MSTTMIIGERAIAQAAAYVLRDTFVKAASNGKVLYVENDILWSKTPVQKTIKQFLLKN